MGARPRHAEIIIDQLGLTDAKPLKLPGVKDQTRRDKQSTAEMEAEVAAVYAENLAKEHLEHLFLIF